MRHKSKEWTLRLERYRNEFNGEYRVHWRLIHESGAVLSGLARDWQTARANAWRAVS